MPGDAAKSVKPVDVARAVRGGTFDTILGRLTMRTQDHQRALPNYIGRVERRDGKARMVSTSTLEASQESPAMGAP